MAAGLKEFEFEEFQRARKGGDSLEYFKVK